MTLIVPETMKYLHVPDHGKIPKTYNGEDLIDKALTALNIWHEYESIIYLFPLDDGGVRPGFQPEFPLFEAEGVPVCNVEVTWASHPWQSQKQRARRCHETMATKQNKILTTWELYSIPTLLLGYQATIAIDRNPSILLGLLATIHDDVEEEQEQACYYPTGDDLGSRRDWRR